MDIVASDLSHDYSFRVKRSRAFWNPGSIQSRSGSAGGISMPIPLSHSIYQDVFPVREIMNALNNARLSRGAAVGTT